MPKPTNYWDIKMVIKSDTNNQLMRNVENHLLQKMQKGATKNMRISIYTNIQHMYTYIQTYIHIYIHT